MKKNSNRGVTVIELVVLIVLVGILAGSLALNTDLGSSQVGGASSLLQSHLLYTKQLALSSRQRVGLVFYPNDKRYEAIAETTELGQQDPFAADPLSVTLDIDSLSTNLESNTILFDPSGQPVKSGGTTYTSNRTITLQSGSKSAQITIETLSGYIHD